MGRKFAGLFAKNCRQAKISSSLLRKAGAKAASRQAVTDTENASAVSLI